MSADVTLYRLCESHATYLNRKKKYIYIYTFIWKNLRWLNVIVKFKGMQNIYNYSDQNKTGACLIE